jgi:predicted DNA-binding transcriptional regulator YafY
MLTDRANTICLLNILREHSDEEHILSMGEIIAMMDSEYGLSTERKTIYHCLNLLLELGYDISMYKDNNRGYFLRERELEISEVRLIMDSIFMNRGISAKQSAVLIKKLQKMTLSAHKRKVYKSLTSVHNTVKTPNKDVFLNIELLDEAITSKRRVSFTYLEYNFKKELKPRRERKYVFSPYGMVAANDFYYLVGIYGDQHKKVSYYRVDRMKDIEILAQPIKPAPSGFDIYKYAKEAIYQHSGDPQNITIECHSKILNEVIDRFGKNVHLAPGKDSDHFVARITANPDGVKLWLLQNLEKCEVIMPKSLRNEVKRAIENSAYVNK